MKRTALLLLILAAFAVQAKEPVKPLGDLKLVEGDEKGNEMKSLKAELLVSAAETKAISQAQKLLHKYRGTAMEAELHFRLAELYMRKAKTDRFFEVHRESDTVVRLAPRTAKSASSRASVQSAIKEYSAIQKLFPSFPQMDVVIFNHAFAMQVMGDEKTAEHLYRHLISKFTRSPLVPDAYLAMGEIEFNRNRFSIALENFNAIRKYPSSRVYPYGLYKAAWTHYNMRDASKGLKALEEVVAFGKMVAEKKIDARLDLRKEALNDMCLFFEDVYPAKSANAYFTAQAGEAEVGPILLRMGSLYERHSRFADQQIVLNQFIEDLPRSPLLPQVHTDLVNANDHLRQKDQAVARIEDFAKLCQPGSDWARANKGVECLNSLNETALRFAKKWLGAWKKMPAEKSFAAASEKAFEIYLRTPGDSEEIAQSRFAYAELLFAQQKFRHASKEYALVSQSPKAGKISHDASYAAVLSLEKAVGEKWSGDDEKTFHELARAYVAKNPKGQYRLDVEYKMALLAYDKSRYEEAAPLFLRLGKEFAGQEKGDKAQDLYLDILNIKKDYRGIRNYTQDLMRGKLALERENKMRKLYEQAYFLEVQSLEEKGKYKEALAEYQAFSRQNAKSELTEKAVWNTMQLQFRLEDHFNGSKTAVDFATRYPASPQAVNALLRAAQSFESMGRLMEAAQVLEKLAVKEEKSASRWRELAADFYAMDNGHDQARKLYSELKSKADAASRVRIMNKLEAFEKAYGTPAQQAAILQQLIDQNIQPQASLARVKSIEQLYANNKLTEAFNEARHWMSSSSMNANQRARLRLVQAKVLEGEFVKQSVKSRAEKVATVLAIKTEKLQKAQEALQSAIKFGDPDVSMEAFERLYNCYTHYVKALKEMPTPAGLSAEDNTAFRAEIGNLVVPLEEKAVDTLAQAVQFSRKHSSLDGNASRLEAELDRVNQQASTSLAVPFAEPALMVPTLAGVSP
jgi:TolA-binding protein